MPRLNTKLRTKTRLTNQVASAISLVVFWRTSARPFKIVSPNCTHFSFIVANKNKIKNKYINPR